MGETRTASGGYNSLPGNNSPTIAMASTAQVIYGTVWVDQAEAPGKVIPIEAPVAAPQFTSPLLDVSFLGDLYIILLGPTLRKMLGYEAPKSSSERTSPLPTPEQSDQWREALSARANEALASIVSKSPSTRLLTDSLRVASVARCAFQICEIGEELCKLLAALSEERGERIARDWNVLRQPWVAAPDTEEAVHSRAQLLTELAKLAKLSVADGGRLLLRIERLTKTVH
jgi:hypothetical protein